MNQFIKKLIYGLVDIHIIVSLILNCKMSERERKFIKVRNTLYNIKYIKEMKCDDNECTFVMANTNSANGTGFSYKDDVLKCNRFNSPDCYENISKFINEQK